MTTAYIQCAAGVSGDMFLGAWLDLGLDAGLWQRQLAGLSVTEYELSVERVKKKGIAATKVHVHVHHSHHHRHLPDIERIIDASDLPQVVKEKAKEAFHHLAVAEAQVHGTTPDKIHFHEVGAVDAIVDIVGSMMAWHMLGEPECVVSPIEVGGGTVECAHGVMPVPAPATARLLQGYPTVSSGLWGETATPTGAAILRTLAKPAPPVPFVPHRVGYGAGTKELPVANVLRIQLGEWAAETAVQPAASERDRMRLDPQWRGLRPVEAVVVEANVDDMNPELAGYVIERLLAAGAMDACWAPLVMKKGRPALRLEVLCDPDKEAQIRDEIVKQTTTIGLRTYAVQKWELGREIRAVETAYGTIPVKVASLGGQTVNVAPEFEACRQAADRHGVPLKQVYQAAMAAAAGIAVNR